MSVGIILVHQCLNFLIDNINWNHKRIIIGKTTRNKPEICAQGFIFNIRKKLADGSYSVRCRQRECGATAILNPAMSNIIATSGEHEHPHELALFHSRQFVVKLKSMANRSASSLEQIYRQEARNFRRTHPNHIEMLPTFL